MCVSLLQGYGIGYPLWALTHLLCFAGAYFCILCVEAYDSVGHFYAKIGSLFWLANFLRLVALFVGGMGFPAVVIFPVFFARRSVEFVVPDLTAPVNIVSNKEEGLRFLAGNRQGLLHDPPLEQR